MKFEDVQIGMWVDVEALDENPNNSEFLGTVVEIIGDNNIVVRDQESNCFSCELSQLSPYKEEIETPFSPICGKCHSEMKKGITVKVVKGKSEMIPVWKCRKDGCGHSISKEEGSKQETMFLSLI